MPTPPPYVSPTPVDLGLHMNDDQIYTARAQYLIGQAETLCLSIVDPLPAAAVVVVVRIAARAYVTITSQRAVQAAQKDNPFAPVMAAGGVTLTKQDKADLRRFAGSGGAFTVNLLDGYCPPALPPWDMSTVGSAVNVPGT